MKKKLLAMLLLVVATTMSAQSLLVGDANQDGRLSVADVTQTADMVLGQTQTTIDLGSLAYKVDNTMVTGTWWLGHDKVTFGADGTTTYPGGATYKFRPFKGTLIVYDADGGLVTILNVLDVTGDALIVSGMEGTVTSYSSSEPHDYVNLGLPSGTLWATCNIGANNPEDYGLYFAWGETTGYTQDTSDGHSFNWTTYQHAIDNSNNLTKYCDNADYGYEGYTDTLTVLDLEDDAAYVNWGSKWRMPTRAQFSELINSEYTNVTWTTQNGVAGRLVTSKTNGNSIFLPMAGKIYYTSLSGNGNYGYYWACTPCLGFYPNYASCVYFHSGDIATTLNERNVGLSIRPVRVSQ